MPKQHLTTESEAPYAELGKQSKGGHAVAVRNLIMKIIGLTKENRSLFKSLPPEVQGTLDAMKANDKGISDTKKKVYAKAKDVQLRKNMEVELSKLTFVLKQVSLSKSEQFEVLLVKFTENLESSGIPETEIARIVGLLVEAHNEAIAAKKPQESYTLYVKV